jgi:hypothetical protein
MNAWPFFFRDLVAALSVSIGPVDVIRKKGVEVAFGSVLSQPRWKVGPVSIGYHAIARGVAENALQVFAGNLRRFEEVFH